VYKEISTPKYLKMNVISFKYFFLLKFVAFKTLSFWTRVEPFPRKNHVVAAVKFNLPNHKIKSGTILDVKKRALNHIMRKYFSIILELLILISIIYFF